MCISCEDSVYSGSGVLFVNENETETKRKCSINGVFETRFEFFRNVVTFSQWNGKNGFRLNAFLFPKTFFETFERLANEMAKAISD